MNLPLITIALPCFNAQDTILRAASSALSQAWPNKEIIIVDDCSTDNSWEIIRKLANDNSTIRAIRNDANLGPGGTRARLLAETQGEFIAFFDDDDESKPKRLKTQYDRIIAYEQETGENLVACYASGIRHYPNGYKKELPAIGTKPIIPKGEGLAESILYFSRRKDWHYGSGTPTCCLMARTETLRSVGGFDPNLRRVEDLDLSIRLSLAGTSFIGCKENLFVQHATIANDKSHLRNLEAELTLAEKYRGFLRERGMYEYAIHWPKMRYYHFIKNYPLFACELIYLLVKYPRKSLSQLMANGPKRLRHERRLSA